MRRVFVITSLLLISGAMGARSKETKGTETNPHQLSDSIVVTANRKPTPRREIGSSVTVITPDQAGTGRGQSVAELLRSVPGVDVVQSGGPGKSTSVFLRGANSHHTLVIIDGVEMNDPSTSNGAFDFANLDADHIERIEILRGSHGVLYGSDAIGGVIQIFSKRGQGDKSQIEIVAEAGSYATFHESIRISGRRSRLDYSVLLGRRDSDGFTSTSSDFGSVEPDGFGSTEVSGQIGLDLTRGYNLRVSGRSMKAITAIDESWGTLDDPNYENETRTRSANLNLHRSGDGQRWFPSIDISYLNQEYLSTNQTDPTHPDDESEYHAEGSRLKLSTQHSLTLDPAFGITVGAEIEEEKYSSERFSDGAWGPSGDTVSEQRARTGSVYLLNELSQANRLFVTMGARLDHHNQFGNEVTWRITSAYLLESHDIKLRASAGNGFKSPTLFQLFHPTWGNPGLQAETSRSWEVGFEKSFGLSGVSLSGTYFDNRFKNLIGTDPDTYQSININEAKSNGFEIEWEYLTSATRLRFQFNHTRTKNVTNEAPILRRPANKFSLSAYQRLSEQFSISAKLLQVGQRTDMNFIDFPSATVTLDKFWLVDLGLRCRLTQSLVLRGRIKNLFDSDYVEVYSYSTSGRTFNLSVSISH